MNLHPNHQHIIDTLTADPTRLIEWAATEMVALGAKYEWDMEDNFACTESLAGDVSHAYGLPGAAGQNDEALRFYGEAAIHLGLNADIEDWED